ncbi:methylaspartate mutase accessory protein GlmL [soil metagenome]
MDVGSTFTKATLVDLDSARVIAAAEHRTTIDTDVLEGLDACVAALGAEGVPVLACSSAGGGLRIAVVGNEALVTAEAGRRVALSSGGKVVAVVAAAGRGPEDDLATVLGHTTPPPDLVLLTGGTDGGNSEVLLAAARELRASGWRGPVVVAGNADAADEVAAILGPVPHVVADNVVPQIGVLRPEGARAAIREAFLKHVIGGKGLSVGDRFVSLVRGATPDVVLTGVEVLATEAGDVVVVDVGGATTDVHSVVELDPALRDGRFATSSGTGPELSRDVVAPTALTRTVEGDLGMRWSAVSTIEAAGRSDLLGAATSRTADPAYLPVSDADHDDDEAIARAAIGLALRRHAGRARVVVGPEGRVTERSGTDLREVDLVVGSGGVLRHGRDGVAARVLAGSMGAGLDGGGQLPEHPRVVVDAVSVLAAVGLLADEHPDAARRLARILLAT